MTFGRLIGYKIRDDPFFCNLHLPIIPQHIQMICYVMGVAGSGKSTIGELLSQQLSLPFFDADAFHPVANIDKMSQGIPLTDQDRIPWLKNIADTARQHARTNGAIFACSALKQQYRDILGSSIDAPVHWIFLEGSLELIRQRMEQRTDHFMPPALLQSQFETLEAPESAIVVDIAESPEVVVARIEQHLRDN